MTIAVRLPYPPAPSPVGTQAAQGPRCVRGRGRQAGRQGFSHRAFIRNFSRLFHLRQTKLGREDYSNELSFFTTNIRINIGTSKKIRNIFDQIRLKVADRRFERLLQQPKCWVLPLHQSASFPPFPWRDLRFACVARLRVRT